MQSMIKAFRAHLWKLLALGLEAIHLLSHAVDLLHHIDPQELSIALDGADHIHIQPAQDRSPFTELNV